MSLWAVLIMHARAAAAGRVHTAVSTATMAVILPDHRRGEFDTWDDPHMPADVRLGRSPRGCGGRGAASTARTSKSSLIDSLSSFFTGARSNLDGLIIAAEEGAAWNVLYPEYHRGGSRDPSCSGPLAWRFVSHDADWLRFLDRWLDFERLDGSLDRLRVYWVEGGGTQKQPPRWCVLRDVLHWLP